MRAYHDAEPVADMMDRLSMPVPEAGCHAWLGKIGTGGYAYIAYRDGSRRLHRKAATVALELAGRPRPEGLEVDHLCRMRWCVNPDHMRYATRSENSLNRGLYGKTPDPSKRNAQRNKRWRELTGRNNVGAHAALLKRRREYYDGAK